MSELWSEQLIKTSISDFLVEELEEHLPEDEVELASAQLSITVESKNDLAKLKTTIASLQPRVEEDFYDYLMEEYEEIEDDLEWKATERGQSILLINDWTQQFSQEFRANKTFDDIFIGGHTSESKIVVTGSVKSQDALDNLVQYLASKTPPLEVLWHVEVCANADE